MTSIEQKQHCEVCDFHRIINCSGGISIMTCRYRDYKNHPVFGDFECPLGDDKPTRKEEIIDLF